MTADIAPPAPAPTIDPAAITPRLLGIHCVAKLLGVGKITVERHTAAGNMPAPRRIGRRQVWDRVELEEWVSRPKPDGRMQNRKEWAVTWAALVKAGKN